MTQTNLSIVRLQAVVLACLLALACLSGCASYETISMEVTAYSSDPGEYQLAAGADSVLARLCGQRTEQRQAEDRRADL